jgi:hypothetical protein
MREAKNKKTRKKNKPHRRKSPSSDFRNTGRAAVFSVRGCARTEEPRQRLISSAPFLARVL